MLLLIVFHYPKVLRVIFNAFISLKVFISFGSYFSERFTYQKVIIIARKMIEIPLSRKPLKENNTGKKARIEYLNG